MRNHLLNAEIISNKKFTREELEEVKNRMEVSEDFLPLYSVFINSLDLNFSGHLELYIEDLEMEFDFQESISRMMEDLDEIVPGGLSNDSKIEWTVGNTSINTVWYKDNNEWVERVSESDRDFLVDERWNGSDYDSDVDPNYGNSSFGEEW